MKHSFKALAAAALLAAGTAQADVVSYTTSTATVIDLGSGNYSFSVGGFSDGGTASGSFSGIDANNDTILNSDDGEVSALSVSYSGGSAIPAFSFTFPFLFGGIHYVLDGGLLGDSAGEIILATDFVYAFVLTNSGFGPLGGCDGIHDCGAVVKFAAVPETGSLPLVLAGLGTAAAVTRRRRSKR